MISKTKMVLAVALVLGLASVAQAAGQDDDGGTGGGYRVGPMGQSFDSGVNPVYHPSFRNAFDYVAPRQQSPRKKPNSR